jgi:hypothetical protein
VIGDIRGLGLFERPGGGTGSSGAPIAWICGDNANWFDAIAVIEPQVGAVLPHLRIQH